MTPSSTFEAPAAAPAPLGFGQALPFWLKLGFISFGGPAGQIAIMHAELVERRRWISEQRFLHALNYCMMLPGPEATQLATYIGWLMHRTRGGLVAGGLFVLPSLAILIALSWMYMAFGTQPLVAGVLWAIKPAIVAIVLHAAWRIGSRTLHSVPLVAISLAAFVAIFAFDVPFPAIIAVAALAGWFGNRVRPAAFRASAAHVAASRPHAPALIDDDTPPPAHATFSRARLLRASAVGIGLWVLSIGALAAAVGWDTTLTQVGWFFSKAAMLTFGGAYAVLPYVFQASVEHYGWLTAPQMIDGLALGETTPGPLIMIVAFVGFVGAWQQQVFGPEWLALAGIAGACVATFFTFLPSFVFIVAGAPFVESTRHVPSLTAPLAAIAAAVVGVIVNLALFFAWHVLWPAADGARTLANFDWLAAAVGALAALLLFRFKVGVVPLIGLCAVLGLVRGFIG